jgi:glycerol-3-phosphate dehydrogenase
LLLNAQESIRIAPVIARIMATELGKDEQWVQEQIDTYTTLAHQYILKKN